MAQDGAFTETGELTTTDGHRIRYTSVGSTDNPIILFIARSTGSGSTYSRLATELSMCLRCVYYDKRGFVPKHTESQPGEPTENSVIPIEQHADDAARLIIHLSPLHSVLVFGTSTGGTIALDLAVRYPSLVRTAILHEPIVFSTMKESPRKSEVIALYQMMAFGQDPMEANETLSKYMLRPWNALSKKEEFITPTTFPFRFSGSKSPREIFNARQSQYDALAAVQYAISVEEIRGVREKLLLVCGVESVGMPVRVPVEEMADALGCDLWHLAGGHASFTDVKYVESFAEQLLGTLRHRGML